MKHVPLLPALLLAGSVLAQVPQPLTLDQAIQTGLQNRTDLKNKRLDIRLAENNLAKARDQWLPKVELSNDFRYNTQLQTTILPPEFAAPGLPANPDGTRIRFGTTFNNLTAANLDQRLYSPTTRADGAIERKNIQIEQESLRQTETEARLSIAEAYFNAQLRREEARLNERRAQRARELLDIAQGRFSLNNIQQDELDRTRVDYQNATVTARKAQRAYQLGQQNLARVLFLPENQGAEPADSLGATTEVLADSAEVLGYVANRSEVRQQQLQGELTTLQDDRARLAALPTVSLYGNYTVQYQSNDLNVFDGRAWSPFNYLGLRATFALLNRNDTKRTRQEYALRAEQAANTLQNQRREVGYELQQAQTNLLDAAQNQGYVRDNLRLAEQVYGTSQERYRLGNLLYADLLDSQRSLQDAEANYLTGLYEYLVARVRWERAKGEPAR
jgi:outer membrane protein TolC